MSNFKIKHDKSKNIIQINTLDERHTNIMNTFQTRKLTVPNKKKKLQVLEEQLKELEDMNASNYTEKDVKRRAELKSEIVELKDDIFDIEHDLSELDYYFKTEDIIMDYYELMDQDDAIFYNENPELCNERNENDLNKGPDALDLLNKMNKNRKPQKVSKVRKKKSVPQNQYDIMDFLSGEPVKPDLNEKTVDDAPVKNKAELLNQFMLMTDSGYVCDKKLSAYNRIRKCEKCDIEKTLVPSDGMFVCQKCGEMEIIIIDSEKPNYKEAVTDNKTGYPYKRSNHLNEWLSQFQAKESIDIPDEIYIRILAELRKNRFYDMKKLNLIVMKKTLKKLQLTQYYEHATYIISKITGIPPPTISRETEEKIRLMFKQIQPPFEKYCPKDRTNFLSYSYVLHKFFQLLELDDFVKYFPLLKSMEKLKQQDQIWKKICYELNWDYYSSI